MLQHSPQLQIWIAEAMLQLILPLRLKVAGYTRRNLPGQVKSC